MPECTGKDLRTAREKAGLYIWQAAGELCVGETTLKGWESGRSRPQSEDVGRMEKLYKCPGLWHRWMRSNDEAYREHYPEDSQLLILPAALVNVRYQIADTAALQDAVERDALDGRIDNRQLGYSYRKQLCELQAAITDALTRMGEEGAKG